MEQRLFAVFGKPILHSKSPQLFNSVFQELRINAFYTRIRPLNGENIIELIRKLGIAGANITTPFKEEVIPFLDSVTNDVLRIGGVNTIVNWQGKLFGFNTDHYGVSRSLTESGITLDKCKCLVLGAGPAARAAIFGLTTNEANVTVANRTHAKAIQISTDFKCQNIELGNVKTIINDIDVIVSTLSPEANPLSDITLPSRITVLDANYRPSEFEQFAVKNGCKIVSGKQWLLNQAIESFKLFTGNDVKSEIMQKGLNIEIDSENVKAIPISSSNPALNNANVDLIISLPNAQLGCFNTFFDEEVYKAFRHTR